jgi:hypothetical protein
VTLEDLFEELIQENIIDDEEFHKKLRNIIGGSGSNIRVSGTSIPPPLSSSQNSIELVSLDK